MSGLDANLLFSPFGLFVDSASSLYIADWRNNRIQKWLAGASNGTTVAGQENGTSGLSSSELYLAAGVLVDSSGNMYVLDTWNHRIQLWASGATFGTTIAGTGAPGSANNELNLPYGIAHDTSTGTLYIADANNHRVMRYLSGAASGTVVAGGNGPGTNTSQLYFPVSIYFEASSNSLVICNHMGNNIVRWVLGASSWTLIAGDINGPNGSISTLLNQPIGMTVDYLGNVYVADAVNFRIQLFLAGQSNGTTIAGVTGISGTNSTLLGIPYALTLDSQLNLYVADTGNNRVQMFVRF
ncbi:unnamed protein product [Rotaria sordida]|uniref:NHL repeat containing protein n=1 Tax=Rotaria sordida TaxID=392033 RepID=A0A813UQ00_9BILA|nr:unnamed protein product [Rotaria sordida]CAF3910022.1 unnamed protein product [Rotaria sordida]